MSQSASLSQSVRQSVSLSQWISAPLYPPICYQLGSHLNQQFSRFLYNVWCLVEPHASQCQPVECLFVCTSLKLTSYSPNFHLLISNQNKKKKNWPNPRGSSPTRIILHPSSLVFVYSEPSGNLDILKKSTLRHKFSTNSSILITDYVTILTIFYHCRKATN